MNGELITGLFTFAGAAVGALAVIVSARVERKWGRAKQQIITLAEQVAAYHKLEEIYKEQLSAVAPALGRPKSILQDMRKKVEDAHGFVRPTMTANEARALIARWKA